MTRYMTPEDVPAFDYGRDAYLDNQADIANDSSNANRDMAYRLMLEALERMARIAATHELDWPAMDDSIAQAREAITIAERYSQ